MKKLSLVVVLAALASCGSGDSPKKNAAPKSVTGASLYRNQQCLQCHGAEGRGMPGMGPVLHNLGEHWTKETLDEYLLDPQAVAAKSERLGQKPYRMKMPPVRGIKDADRAQLIDYILTL